MTCVRFAVAAIRTLIPMRIRTAMDMPTATGKTSISIILGWGQPDCT